MDDFIDDDPWPGLTKEQVEEAIEQNFQATLDHDWAEREAREALEPAISREYGRQLARTLYPDLGFCERCLTARAIERHHIDHDTTNNERMNIEFLCQPCHRKEERIYRRRKRVARLEFTSRTVH